MPGGLRIRPGVTDARTRSTIGKITGRGLNTSAASAVRPPLNMAVVRATGTGSILTRLIGWKNKPGMTDVPTKRIIGLAIARVSKAGISINLDNLVLANRLQDVGAPAVARHVERGEGDAQRLQVNDYQC